MVPKGIVKNSNPDILSIHVYEKKEEKSYFCHDMIKRRVIIS